MQRTGAHGALLSKDADAVLAVSTLLGGCVGRSALYTSWRIVSAARRAAGGELHPLRAVLGAAPAPEKMCRTLGAAGGSARGTRSAMRAHRS